MKTNQSWYKRHWKLLTTSTFIVALIMVASVYALQFYNKADAAVASVTNGGSVTELLKSEQLDGETTGRSNILIAGNSADDADHGGAMLTDSIMVVSIDVTTNKVTTISLPRDLWVSIDGYGSMKLNAVFTLGGIDMLESSVENILGITINHHVLINYTAFQQAIDAVGGIDITIESSDPRGIYDPNMNLTLASGIQHLDGATALKLSRSRNVPTYDGRIAYGLPDGDFDRTLYQRKIAEALMKKVATVQVLTNQSQLMALLESVNGNVTSNLSAGQLRRIYDLSKLVSTTQSVSIRGEEGNYLLSDYTGTGGQSALIPFAGIGDYTAIQQYILPFITNTTSISSP